MHSANLRCTVNTLVQVSYWENNASRVREQKQCDTWCSEPGKNKHILTFELSYQKMKNPKLEPKYPRSDWFPGVKSNPSSSDLMCLLVGSLILAPNHLFTSLMTSKLIYNRVIYMAKNGSLISGFLSVLTVDDVSIGPLGVMLLRSLYVPLGYNMSSSPRTLYLFLHTLCCSGLSDSTPIWKQNTICHKCGWNVGFVTESVPHVMYGEVEGNKYRLV